MSNQKEKKDKTFWKIIGGIVVVVLISVIFDSFTLYIPTLKAEWPLREYKDDIKNCVAEQEAEQGDIVVIGTEYACAIDVASTFYDEDPEKAIDLCSIYNPFFDIRLGREYSSLNADDLYDRNNENIARASCKYSIERGLK